MVLVDITWNDGTKVRLDIPQAAIDFYEKQGVTVIRVPQQTEIVDSPIIRPTLKMNQIRFPTISPTFEGINGEVQFDSNFSLVGHSGFFRILVHNLTGNDRTERKINFDFGTRSTKNISYIAPIPAGARRIRIELQGFVSGIASNVFNESHIKTPDEPTPTTFKNCQCCGKTIRIPATEPCPECGTCNGDQPTPTLGNFDKLVMGALIAGAILPLTRSKKK